MAVGLIATYSDLKDAVADYLIRTDLPTQIQLAISLAEAEFNRKIRNRRMEQRATTTTIGGQSYYELPPDFLEQRSMALVQNPRVPIVYRTPQQFEYLYPDQTATQPEAFSIVDAEFRLGPTPNGVYTVEILYYQQIPALGSIPVINGVAQPAITTNWLLTNHPDIYLFQTLIQMSVLLRDTDMGGAASALYQNAMQSLTSEETREQWNGSPLMPTTDVCMP